MVFFTVSYHVSFAASEVKNPIPELGNCDSQAACKSYCDEPAHISACVSYAETHGMISKKEADLARKFEDVLKGEGPGQCKTKETCEAYCNDISHLKECVTFGEAHGLIPNEDLSQAKKISNALANGAKLPGNCTSKSSCENYCQDSAHIEECLTFGEQSGLISKDDVAEAKKVIPLIMSGNSPGQCKTKQECEKYCNNSEHTLECVNFAEKAGLIAKDEADMVRKTGGKGPGNCTNKNACEAYCNDPAHSEECLKFASENGLIPSNQLKNIKDGLGRLRGGLAQLPKELTDCLKNKLGENIVGQMESGKFTPGPQTGATIQSCVEEFQPQLKAKIASALRIATPAVNQCLENTLGKDGLIKLKNGEAPDPDKGDAIKSCFKEMQTEGLTKMQDGLAKMPPEMKKCILDKLGLKEDSLDKIAKGENIELGPETMSAVQSCAGQTKNDLMSQMEDNLKGAPPEIRDCIKEKLVNLEENVQSGKIRGPEDVQPLIQECVNKLNPEIPVGGNPPSGYKTGDGPSASDSVPPSNYQPTADICAKFNMAPSCDYVPEAVRPMCEKCKKQ